MFFDTSSQGIWMSRDIFNGICSDSGIIAFRLSFGHFSPSSHAITNDVSLSNFKKLPSRVEADYSDVLLVNWTKPSYNPKLGGK